ncbi:MAG: polymerase subunit delta [Acidimicrobiaceae bacterium]|nr:polymerase subunit delta [Acidimicrobiaceae bacterium]
MEGMPDTQLFADVIGQDAAVSSLRAAIVRPVHAYLLVGPAGSGKRASALSFAASLLCAAGGDGTCDICRRVLGGIHPDLVAFEREGPWITIGMAQQVSLAAARSPVEGDRKVLMLSDFHLVKEAGPALLKTIEEPPPSTVFVITAEFMPPELVTIASRCVVIEFRPLPMEAVAAALQAGGVEAGLALELATAADGRLDRARLLAGDPEFGVRRRAWQAVPERLDGNGATAVAIAGELVAHLERSVAPLRTRHDTEVAELDARVARANEVTGGKAGKRPAKTGAKELEERHRREIRRQRTDELRAGLAALAGVYRDRLAAGGPSSVAGDAVESVRLIQELYANLAYNPNELLQLQALLVKLGRQPARVG